MSAGKIILDGLTVDDLREIFREEMRQIIREEIVAFNSNSESEKLLTADETCSYLKITRPTLDKYAKLGTLNKLRMGSKVYFKKTEVEAALIKMKTYLRPAS